MNLRKVTYPHLGKNHTDLLVHYHINYFCRLLTANGIQADYNTYS